MTHPVQLAEGSDSASALKWQRVSVKYAWVDLAGHLCWSVIVAALVILLTLNIFGRPPLFVQLIAVVAGVALCAHSALAFRRVRAIGYILRADDLLFRRGLMCERVVAVPYGRLQLVDVTRGPLLRALGLASLKFVTASAATGVYLPGLPLAEAEQLRDRLVDLAETRRQGI